MFSTTYVVQFKIIPTENGKTGTRQKSKLLQ